MNPDPRGDAARQILKRVVGYDDDEDKTLLKRLEEFEIGDGSEVEYEKPPEFEELD
jgi:hypothetical protein